MGFSQPANVIEGVVHAETIIDATSKAAPLPSALESSSDTQQILTDPGKEDVDESQVGESMGDAEPAEHTNELEPGMAKPIEETPLEEKEDAASTGSSVS